MDSLIDTAMTKIKKNCTLTFNNFPLTSVKFKEFLAETYNYDYSDVKYIANQFTPNIDALTVMLQELHQNVDNRNIKYRITRIINLLNDNEQ